MPTGKENIGNAVALVGSSPTVPTKIVNNLLKISGFFFLFCSLFYRFLFFSRWKFYEYLCGMNNREGIK